MAYEIRDMSAAALRKITRLSVEGARDFAELMFEHAHEHASAGGPPVDTGHLRDSQVLEPVGDKGLFRIYTSTAGAWTDGDGNERHSEEGYGGYVHEGTSTRPANPWLTRAFSKTLGTFNAEKAFGE